MISDKLKELLEKIKKIFSTTGTLRKRRLFRWNNNKPSQKILYNGRIIPGTKIRALCDVRLFVTPNDPRIISELEKKELLVDNPGFCDDKIVEIYRFLMNRYFSYLTDKRNVGINELWFFPFETWMRGKGDCEDYAHMIASYLIAAGVPRERVRCVAGTTWQREGHCTVYVLNDSLDKWHHLNSTTLPPLIWQKRLKDFPTSNDEKDLLGIKNVWFSYNDKNSWQKFENVESQKSFREKVSSFVSLEEQ